MKFDLPNEEPSIIKVIGVGGGGSNAVNHMFREGIVGVDFAVCNTDSQALEDSPVPMRIHLGPMITEGRGAGSRPQVGKQACIESIDEVRSFLAQGTKMLFVTAGMGGGTGTGAAPIIAKAARDMGILTVGIVTLPFSFEGRKRVDQGSDGLEELRNSVDSLIVISNDRLRKIHGNLPISEAFAQADDILTMAARGIAEIITVSGNVNVDFEDVNTVMRDSGVAIMGTATTEGENRAREAVISALSSPLLEDNDIRGARHILVNISSGSQEVTMDEIAEVTEYVQGEAGYDAVVIWGICQNENLANNLSVTIIATGFDQQIGVGAEAIIKEEKIVVSLDEDLATPEIEMPEHVAMAINPIPEKAVQKPAPDSVVMDLPQELPLSMPDAQTIKKVSKQLRSEQIKPIINSSTRPPLMESDFDNPRAIMDFENQPAYLRRGVELEIIDPDAERISNYTIDGSDSPELRDRNKFLDKGLD